MTLAFLLGLASALLYGVTDFIARFAGRAVGVLRTMLYGQLLAAACFTAWLFVQGFRDVANGTPAVWLATLGADVCILSSTAARYRGLTHGSVVVVAPIAACYGAVTTVFSVLAGERLAPLALIGLAVTVAGGALTAIPASVPPAERPVARASTGALAATIAALGYGFGFFLQGRYSVPALGHVVPVWSYYVLGSLVLTLVALARGQSLRPPERSQAPFVFGTGALAASAYVALAAGYASGYVSIVTVLSSIASAVTVLLARFILAERVSAHQWAGLLLVVFGLLLVRWPA